jgi:two-component system, chemotaxis family, sensor kinase CheA
MTANALGGINSLMPGASAGKTASDGAQAAQQSLLGKYREIIIAVGFFLLFDLGVLVLNFYTSYQISEDATAINLSGRQRMLSQRTTKAIYAVQERAFNGLPLEADSKELGTAITLFDDTLKGFRQGGTVTGGDGKPVVLNKVTQAQALEVLEQAQKVWDPLYSKARALTLGAAQPPDIAEAVGYARENNVKLLGLMNQLTTALEAEAAQRAANLRLVQTGGIFLALINFAFILFKFLRRLRTSDAAIEAANEENREILSSVREGLFLITPDLRLGTQMAASVSDLFGRRVLPGEHFISVLQPLVSAKTLEDGRNYISLLFAPHVKEALVQSINPLNEVSMQSTNAFGVKTQRHLSFYFKRVLADEGSKVVRHLLVTVQDISPRIELEQKLQEERSRAEKEFSMFLSAIEAEPTTLRMFIDRSEAAMLEVNDLLRSTAQAQTSLQMQKAIDGAFRRVHAFKGEAASLGLDVLAQIAHQFESGLQSIKDQPDASPDALLSLPLPLEDLLSKIAALKKLIKMDRVSAAGNGPAGLTRQIEHVVKQISADVGKQVRADIDLPAWDELGTQRAALCSEIVLQLVRNAVVHGIESPQERSIQNKALPGAVTVRLTADEDGQLELLVRDDGAGLSAVGVREKLRQLGWYNAEDLVQMTDQQVMPHIFKPGFSTAKTTSLHAGRGVGLDVVQAHVSRLGGQLLVSSRPQEHTSFRIRFGA